MKPISPKQAKRMVLGSPEHLAHLKKTVVRRLNRELKRGSRSINVENHISIDQAGEIAGEYRAQGWHVHVKDRTGDGGRWAWTFTFSVDFKVGDTVIVDLIDRYVCPEPFPAKVIAKEPAGPYEFRFRVGYQKDGKSYTHWLASRYLSAE